MTDQKDKLTLGGKTEGLSDDNPVFPAAGVSPEASPGQGREIAPTRTLVDIINHAVDEAQEVMRIAIELSRALNNDRVRAVHLLLALTLTPRGVERLSHYKLSRETIRKTCWKELSPMDPPGDATRGPNISDNVGDIIRRAQERADVRAFRITVDDLVVVVSTSPLRERYERYWTEITSVDPVKRTLELVSAMSISVGGSLERKLEELSNLSTQTAALQRGVAKRVSYVKHASNVIVALSALGVLAVAALSYFGR